MIELTKENFETEVLEASGVIFVDFWSPKCEHCMALLPDVEAFAEKNAGRAKFCKLDTSVGKRLAMTQGVMGLPTFVFYKDGAKAFVFGKEEIELPDVEAKLNELLG